MGWDENVKVSLIEGYGQFFYESWSGEETGRETIHIITSYNLWPLPNLLSYIEGWLIHVAEFEDACKHLSFEMQLKCVLNIAFFVLCFFCVHDNFGCI